MAVRSSTVPRTEPIIVRSCRGERRGDRPFDLPRGGAASFGATPTAARTRAAPGGSSASASASAASGGSGHLRPACSSRVTIVCTATLSAPPSPVTASFTSLGLYCTTGIPARAATTSASPLACPDAIAVRTFIVLIYGLAATAFGLADLAVGQIEELPDYIRTGEFDVMLLRPLGTLPQLLSADVALRRIGRVAVGVAVLAWGLQIVEWTPLRVLVAVVAPVSGAVLLAAIWVTANCVSFWLVDGREVANSVTYGSDFATSYPITVYGPWLRRIMCFAVPGAFVAYFPALALLGRPDPLGLPDVLRYCSPLVALVAVGVTALVWRTGVRRYQGTGREDARHRTQQTAGARRRDPVIETDGLRREFVVGTRLRRRHVTAVEGVTLTIAPGEAVGFLGPNGAGKSTTIKMLTGVLVPTAGHARVCGLDPVRERRELARRIGVVFGQRSQLWWDLPLRESFDLHGAIHGVPYRERLDECVEMLDMAGFLATPVRQLSLGQRMRGEVTAALLHRPELLVLDEPTIGLDLASKERLRAFLADVNGRGDMTLLLTTHDLPDVERLCRRVVVIDKGRLLVDDELAVLRDRFGWRGRSSSTWPRPPRR